MQSTKCVQFPLLWWLGPRVLSEMILQPKKIPRWGLDQESMGGGELVMLKHLIVVFQHVHYSVWRHCPLLQHYYG